MKHIFYILMVVLLNPVLSNEEDLNKQCKMADDCKSLGKCIERDLLTLDQKIKFFDECEQISGGPVMFAAPLLKKLPPNETTRAYEEVKE